ncbi:HD domain-containing protein [bacterium]|nr:HD domain-containing protein [bacterium]
MDNSHSFRPFLSDLLELFKEVTHLQDRDHVLQKIGNFTYKFLECENIVIWLWDDREELLKPFKYWGFTPDEMKGHVYEKGEGLPGTVFKKGVPLFEKSLKDNENYVFKNTAEDKIRNLLMVPIFFKEEVIGVLDVSNKTDGTFSSDDFNKLLLISFILSIILNITSNQDEATKNYQYYSSLVDIFGAFNFANSDEEFFSNLKSILANIFRTEVVLVLRKNGVIYFPAAIEDIPENLPVFSQESDIVYELGAAIVFIQILNYDIYFILKSSETFRDLINGPEKSILIREILKRVVSQYFDQRKLSTKNYQFDLLYRIGQQSLDTTISTSDLLKSFAIEIYETYKLYSLEILAIDGSKYTNIVTEGLYKRDIILVPVEASIISLLNTQDVFILNAENSNLYGNFVFNPSTEDNTVSLFSTALKDENGIHFILIFRWDEIFSPEMNFFNFLDLLKKEILAKDYSMQLMDKLNRTTNETIKLLMTVLSYKDPEIISHSKRVAEVAVALTELFSLNINSMDMRLAAYLHDLGKVGIEDSLLKSSKEFTSDEFDLVKRHSEIGYDLIKNYDYPTDLKKSILLHHEKWNGEGYPKGLSGEEIPVFVRIMTISDSIDAILSERPYKIKKSFSQLKKELRNESGKSFDPTLTNILINNWEVFLDKVSHIYEKSP